MPRKIAKGMSRPQQALPGYSLSAEKKAEFEQEFEDRTARKRAQGAKDRLEAEGFQFGKFMSHIKHLRG